MEDRGRAVGDCADDLPARDLVAFVHADTVNTAIDRHQVIAVADEHDCPEPAERAGDQCDLTIGSGAAGE